MGSWWEKRVGRRLCGFTTRTPCSEVAEGMPLALSFLWESLRCIAHKACLIAATVTVYSWALLHSASIHILKVTLPVSIGAFSYRYFIEGTKDLRVLQTGSSCYIIEDELKSFSFLNVFGQILHGCHVTLT